MPTEASLALQPQMIENAMGGVETVEGETFAEYLVRLSWVGDEDELELTAVGRALLKALNAPALDEGASDVFEVVLDPGRRLSARIEREQLAR